MAREEIKLVGSFDDQITKKLQKLNREITNIGRSFERFNQKLAPVTKNFAKMSMSAKSFAQSMQMQRQAMDSSARAMANYRKEAGKMTGAMRKVTEARVRAQRQMGMSRAQMRQGGGMRPTPQSTGTVSPKAMTGAGRQMGLSFREAVGATALGGMIGSAAMNVLGRGARMIGGIAMKPVNYLKEKYFDRVQDEMADLKSAGGLMAIDMEATGKSGNQALFNSVTDALQFQEKLNIDAAKSAASLPGVTQQYVDVKRQLTDTVQLIMEQGMGEDKGAESREAFLKFSEGFGADVSMGGNEALKEGFSAVLGDLTEKTVLISQGQQGGLPMHIFMQELLNKEVNNKGDLGLAAMTKKYRAAFKTNPMLKKFLIQYEDQMKETAAGSVERLELVSEVLGKAMPASVVNKMRGTISGMTEAFNSAFFDQQSGLFGLSRPVENVAGGTNKIKRAVNDLNEELFTLSADLEYNSLDGELKTMTKGTRVSKEELARLGIGFEDFNGNLKLVGDSITKGANQLAEVSMDQSYLFEVIRETMSGFGVPLLQLAGLIPQVFDPFFEAVQAAMPLRDAAVKFNKGFLQRSKEIENLADSMAEMGNKGAANKLRKSAITRGALSMFADTLGSMGVLSQEMRDEINDAVSLKNFGKPLKDITGAEIEGQNFGKFLGPIFDALMKSDLVLKQIPEAVGGMIGSLIKAAGDFITGGLQGLIGGQEGALTTIVSNLMESLFAVFATDEAKTNGKQKFDEMMAKVVDTIGDVIGQLIDAFFTYVLPEVGKLILRLAGTIFDKGGLLGKGLVIGVPLAIANLIGSLTGLNSAIGAVINAFGGVKGIAGGVGKMLKRPAIQGPALPPMQGPQQATKKKLLDFFFKDVKGSKGVLEAKQGSMMSNVNRAGKGAANLAKRGKDAVGTAAKKTAETLAKPLQSASKNIANMAKTPFGGALKSGLKLGAVGGIITAITKMLEGQSILDAISGGLASAGGSAIGAAIGTVLLGPFGTALGAWIGGMIADTEAVIAPIRGAIDAIMSSLQSAGDILMTVIDIVSDIVSAVISLIPGMDNVADGFNLLGAAVTVLLMPFRLLALGLQGLAIALTEVKKFLAQFGIGEFTAEDEQKLVSQKHGLERETDRFTIDSRKGFGDSLEAQKNREMTEIRKLEALGDKRTKAQTDELHKRYRYNKVLDEQIAAETARGVERKKNPVNKQAEHTAETLSKLDGAAQAAGSTFENNKKFALDGKEYGWAMKDGKQVLVEWGAVVGETAESLREFQKAAEVAAEATKIAESESYKAADADVQDTIARLRQGRVEPTSTAGTTNVAAAGANIPGRVEGRETIVTGNDFIDQGGLAGFFSRMFGGGGEGGDMKPPIPTPEETGVAEVARNTEAAQQSTDEVKMSLDEMKTPVMELPMRMDESMMKQTMELSTIIGTYMAELSAKADEVVAALASKEQDQVTIAGPLPLPVNMSGLAGMMASLKTGGGKHKGWFPMYAGNVHSAAGGMNLGSAIATEMKHKPAGSDLVIANSSETIIPASMRAGMAGGGAANVQFGDINVNVSGADNPKEIANQVAEEIMAAVQRATYTELYTS